MVDVIGKDEAKFKKCTCRNCASILRYTESEVQNHATSNMGDTGHVWYIICPACGDKVVTRSY